MTCGVPPIPLTEGSELNNLMPRSRGDAARFPPEPLRTQLMPFDVTDTSYLSAAPSLRPNSDLASPLDLSATIDLTHGSDLPADPILSSDPPLSSGSPE